MNGQNNLIAKQNQLINQLINQSVNKSIVFSFYNIYWLICTKSVLFFMEKLLKSRLKFVAFSQLSFLIFFLFPVQC